jgi:hypothetical protein
MKSLITVIIIWSVGWLLAQWLIPLNYHLLGGYALGMITFLIIDYMDR